MRRLWVVEFMSKGNQWKKYDNIPRTQDIAEQAAEMLTRLGTQSRATEYRPVLTEARMEEIVETYGDNEHEQDIIRHALALALDSTPDSR